MLFESDALGTGGLGMDALVTVMLAPYRMFLGARRYQLGTAMDALHIADAAIERTRNCIRMSSFTCCMCEFLMYRITGSQSSVDSAIRVPSLQVQRPS